MICLWAKKDNHLFTTNHCKVRKIARFINILIFLSQFSILNKQGKTRRKLNKPILTNPQK